jgi:hypothetical protein
LADGFLQYCSTYWSCCIYLLFGAAPWDLEVTNVGDVPFTEYLGGAVGRF